MRARYGLPLVLGAGVLASSSVLCIRAGMAVPQDLSTLAVAPHSRSAHGTRGGRHPWAADSSTTRLHSSPASVPAAAAPPAPITPASVVWRH